MHALVCDLLGEDPTHAPCSRPTIRQALARTGRGEVAPARQGERPMAVVVLHDGRAYAVPDRCPHAGALLSDGFVDGTRLVCPHHGWEFDLETGACPGRPRVSVDVHRLGR